MAWKRPHGNGHDTLISFRYGAREPASSSSVRGENGCVGLFS
jgi:hypothetical protein